MTLLVIMLLLAGAAVGFVAGLLARPRVRDPRLYKYEDFLLRLAADDVGDPALEARLTIQEARKKDE